VGTNYFAVHAHFHQPSRINPFTGRDYPEPEAAPFRNFNEMVTAQCYRPNVELGNLEFVSFDFGPTLTQWFALRHPDLLARIVASDRSGIGRFGYGNALAMPFGHPILPLLSDFDKRLHVRWGIDDFELRFARKPDGMWLPETALDLDTLEVLVDEGIRFTLVAIWQLASTPAIPNRPYLVELPSGRTITCFVFDPQLSKHLSFNPRISESAPAFASLTLPMRLDWRLELEGYDQLLLVATDGELYGHHQKFRDLFLSDLLHNRLAENGLTLSTVPAVFRLLPAREVVLLRELSSWSCFHNLGRWAGGCPCSPGNGWKGAFYAALSWLWQQLLDLFDVEAGRYSSKPRELLLNYLNVKLGLARFEDVLASTARTHLSTESLKVVERLCEAMYYRALSQGSDALFFDELLRLEPRYVLAAAKRAITLVGDLAPNLEHDFLARLAHAVSLKSGAKASEIYVHLGEDEGATDTG
jgi:hypothetical protein